SILRLARPLIERPGRLFFLVEMAFSQRVSGSSWPGRSPHGSAPAGVELGAAAGAAWPPHPFPGGNRPQGYRQKRFGSAPSPRPGAEELGARQLVARGEGGGAVPRRPTRPPRGRVGGGWPGGPGGPPGVAAPPPPPPAGARPPLPARPLRPPGALGADRRRG